MEYHSHWSLEWKRGRIVTKSMMRGKVYSQVLRFIPPFIVMSLMLIRTLMVIIDIMVSPFMTISIRTAKKRPMAQPTRMPYSLVHSANMHHHFLEGLGKNGFDLSGSIRRVMGLKLRMEKVGEMGCLKTTRAEKEAPRDGRERELKGYQNFVE